MVLEKSLGINDEENTSISRESQLLDELDAQLRLQHREPDNPVHAHQCGRVYAQLGDLQNAVGFYRQALRLDGNYAAALLDLGTALQSLGKTNEAENSLRAAVDVDPRNMRAHLILGGFLESMKRFDESLQCVQNALSLDPNHLDAQLQLGRLYLQREELDKARQLLEPLSEQHNYHAEVWNLLGLMHARTNEPAQARTCYQKALEFNPKQAEIWTHLGNVLVHLDEESEAEKAYRQAVEYQPENPDYWFNLGEFYFQRSNYQAEHALMQTVRLNKKDWEAWELLNKWYKDRGYPARRRLVLRMLAAYHPDREDVLIDLAAIYEQMNEFNEARQVLEKLERLKPDDTKIKQQSVRVFLKQGHIDEVYTRIKGLDPADPAVHDILVHLGQRLKFRHQYQKAEECLLSASQTRPDSPQLWYMLAELAQQRKDHQETFVRLCKSGDLSRNQASSWLPLAEHFSASQPEKAEACYECLYELTCYRTDLWNQIIKVARLAGSTQEKKWLERFYRWLDLEQIHHQHWDTLAELYQQAKQPEKAQQCRQFRQDCLQKEAQEQAEKQQVLHRITHPSSSISDSSDNEETSGQQITKNTEKKDPKQISTTGTNATPRSTRNTKRRLPSLLSSNDTFQPPPEFEPGPSHNPLPAPIPFPEPAVPIAKPEAKATDEPEAPTTAPTAEPKANPTAESTSKSKIDTPPETSPEVASAPDPAELSEPIELPKTEQPEPQPPANHPELHKDIDSIVADFPDHT